LILLIIVILYNTPQARAKRIRKEEKRQQQKKEQEEKKRLEAEQRARQMENLRRQRLVVYIREKDGRKNTFEGILIRELLKLGITVEVMSENNGRAIANGDTFSLKNGLLALVGTSWYTADTGGGFLNIYCDYRLLGVDKEGRGKILGAGYEYRYNTYREDLLAHSIIEDISSTLPETPEDK
jgi:hypothetical protein